MLMKKHRAGLPNEIMIKYSTRLLKNIGKKSGPPPKKGPVSQGLKLSYKKSTRNKLEKI